MKTVSDHIDYVKGKPHQVRKQLAFFTAGGVTAVIALVWFVGNLSFGNFAIRGSNFAESSGAENAEVVHVSNDAALAGVAAATQKDEPAHIEIVDTTPTTPTKKKIEQTVIPF